MTKRPLGCFTNAGDSLAIYHIVFVNIPHQLTANTISAT